MVNDGRSRFGCKSNGPHKCPNVLEQRGKAFPACKERKYPMARDMTPRQVAEAYLAAWNAHDADAAAALMADDVTYFDDRRQAVERA